MEYLRNILKELIQIAEDLETKYSNYKRKFTLDGHLFGSTGEVYAAKKFDLTLLKSSYKGHDAKDKNGNLVQIKVTQKTSVGSLNPQKQNLVINFIIHVGFVINFFSKHSGNAKISIQ